MAPLPDFRRLSDTDKDRRIDVLFAPMDALEARLGMNSLNSAATVGWPWRRHNCWNGGRYSMGRRWASRGSTTASTRSSKKW